MMLDATFPDNLRQASVEAYEQLEAEAIGRDASECLDIAVSSSTTAEDLPDARFAGQQETYQ